MKGKDEGGMMSDEGDEAIWRMNRSESDVTEAFHGALCNPKKQ